VIENIDFLLATSGGYGRRFSAAHATREYPATGGLRSDRALSPTRTWFKNNTPFVEPADLPVRQRTILVW
jgi:hypothetical protein